METTELDRLVETVVSARELGQDVDLEALCADQPELLQGLREKLQAAKGLEDPFCTRVENATEPQYLHGNGLAALVGHRLVMQTELHVGEFCDRGGLGEVYRATDGESSRELAVKLLRSDRKHPSNHEDFKRESQIIGRMNHPGIVAIHGCGETIDGRPFYAMPFLKRGNLRQSIGDYHRHHRTRTVDAEKSFRDLLYRLVSVCKTVAYAHSRGIVHRDIKGENILLGKYGETLVIDWGSATRVQRDERFRIQGEETLQLHGVNDSSSSGGITLRYASPEQLHGSRPIGPESDIYSLGATLYLMLTGRSPLENVPDPQVRQQVLAGGVAAPDQIKPGIPKSLVAICNKAMALEPGNRYATAMDLADDLERFLADESVSVCRDSAAVKIVRTIRRNRTASFAIFGALFVGSVALLFTAASQGVMAGKAQRSAQDRLKMAATMVATMGGMEIDRRIKLLEEEAASPKLKEILAAVDAEPETRKLWEAAQLHLYAMKDRLQDAGVDAESVFLMGVAGTQIARAPEGDSIGNNFAYRHYYHGVEADWDLQSERYKTSPPQMSMEPVLSNAYVSTNQAEDGRYPVKSTLAVTVESEGIGSDRRPLGRLGISIFINDLKVFEKLSQLSIDAVLVETRDYPWGSGSARGLLLDHLRHSGDNETVRRDANRNATENMLMDAMPRLSQETAESMLRSLEYADGAVVIPNFSDPEFGNKRLDAACAELKLPYRQSSNTNWMVLFIEADKPHE